MKKNLHYFLFLSLFLFFSSTLFAQQAATSSQTVQPVKNETSEAIMQRQALAPAKLPRIRPEFEELERDNLPQNPLSKPQPTFPFSGTGFTGDGGASSFVTGTSFNGVTGPTETGAFPPDDMGAIGPTQYILAVNGRIRSFNKTTGTADAVLNVDPDVFFSSVMTPVSGSVTQVFTSDPRIRYDRISARWLIIIIDVPLDVNGNTPVANRVLVAVSNSSTISGSTVWTFTQFTGQASTFFDYPTLGLDINGIYIGGNMFSLAGSFLRTNAYVINRANVMAGGAYTVYMFSAIATTSVAGPYTPQGVDNFDLSATEGYFIGVDVLSYGILQIRRISTPAGVPTISANITVTVNTTSSPRTTPHLGNTGGLSGQLDAVDDRLYAAVMRGGRLWTAHCISVNTSGVAATSGTVRRNGNRWYELQNLTGTPTVFQSGTIFDPAVTASNPRWYSFPTIMVSGQGHAVFGMTSAGNNDRANAAATVHLSGDAAGTTQTAALLTASSTAYNPPGDPGPGRRWGDYSYVSLDPLDDMTMWTVNQYCSGTNEYGCNVTKILAPPPATPTSTLPTSTAPGQTSVDIVITGTAVSGSGFYDPGADMAAPALPFNHITASVSGGDVTVNSVTYTDPTHITININTVGAVQGARNITVTNPDGQTLTGTGIFSILNVVPITSTGLHGKLNNNLTVSLNWSTESESNNKGFFIERIDDNSSSNWVNIGFVSGAGNSVSTKNYSSIDNNIQLDKIYRYRLKQVDFDGNYTYSNEVVIRVKDLQKNILILSSSPNPFKSKTLIRYNLPADGFATLKVYDITGKEIAVLQSGFQKAGVYTKEFNAAKLSSGSYFCKLVFGEETLSNQLLLVD